MQVPGGYRRVEDGSCSGVVREDLARLPLESFWAEGEPLSGARGRGAVVVLSLDGHRGVARRYRRGGALRRLLPDRFLSPRRAVHELAVLDAMRRSDVPAVEPLAAVARRSGLLHELRLVTRLVPGALPLPAFCAREPGAAREVVQEAGRVVARAFSRGLCHPDLHPDNLVVAHEDGVPRVLLVDLDRASLHPELPGRVRDRMLLRMARYLERHAGELPAPGRAVDRLRFLRGMGLDRRRRRAALARLQPLYERAVRRHRASWGRWRAVALAGALLAVSCNADRWAVGGSLAYLQPRVSGHAALAGSAAPGSTANRRNGVRGDLDLDDPSHSPLVRAEGSLDRFRVRVGGYGFAQDATGLLRAPYGDIAAGSVVHGELDFLHLTMLADWQLLRTESARLGAGVAAQYVGVDLAVADRSTGLRETVDSDALVPMPTATGEVVVGPARLGGEIGAWTGDLGDATGTWVDAELRLGVHPHPQVELFAGYRWLRMQAEGRADERRFEGELDVDGWFVGGAVHFGGHREPELPAEGTEFRPPLH